MKSKIILSIILACIQSQVLAETINLSCEYRYYDRDTGGSHSYYTGTHGVTFTIDSDTGLATRVYSGDNPLTFRFEVSGSQFKYTFDDWQTTINRLNGEFQVKSLGKYSTMYKGTCSRAAARF